MFAEKIQLENDEVILAMVRKHWFVIGIEMFGIVLLSLFPFIGIHVLELLPFQFSLEGLLGGPALYYLSAVWVLMMWMALFNVWTNYYLDVWTITNKRLVSVDQHGLFSRSTGSFRLERLQDINVNVSGILATFLNFGTLQVETASEDRDFVARNIPKPQELKALILKAADDITFPNHKTSEEF